ncbi:hypothetical protein [Paraburkholderia domus]|jgi:hypothetical protein|uniref:Lipoprotein n=1 Tax=Paraburkholderia domus TaxID=2793075 RepID=A0A9N8ML17_9BURK|nr:hypothetical protein [Paraburkholderia domus]MBK5051048.1 hypothetical protein [Burkholderia sp. R-70006]MBK5064988.1 hypothetical protein [Burkholderia sp. R-70199]MBK5118626.1 hypothetical protein [Burkholderia sp. R-69980]MBK5164464.1 hypothetical protein [Burkholderia sp. R-70211]MCI0144646.1 hypothetical protein [Paraburkholderia sediminicola]
MKLEHLVLTGRAALVLTLGAALGGCMTSTPVWDAHFGEAAHTAAAMQIIDPHAAEHTPSTLGVDGKAAVAAQDAYDKSFQAPVTTLNPFVIGIGSGNGGGSGGQ